MDPQPSEAGRSEEKVLADARAGSPEAVGEVLELCRRYLLQIAQAELDTQLLTKFGASDLVQETFLEAHRIFNRFHGDSPVELRAWLRAILLNKLADGERHYEAGKRRIDKEVSLDSRVGEQATPATTPSRVLMQEERAAALTAAIDRLPPDYRQVIIWRQVANLSFEEMAERMNRSVDAVRKLWWRAIQQLQAEIGNSL